MKIKILAGLGIATSIALIHSFFTDICGLENSIVRNLDGFAPLILLAVGLFFSMKKIKNEEYNNDLNFGQAIFSGIVISIVTAITLGGLFYIYYQYINVNYADQLLMIDVPLMQKNKLTPAQISEEITRTKESLYPINILRGTFVFILVSGIAFSAIISSIIRTRETFTEIAKKK